MNCPKCGSDMLGLNGPPHCPNCAREAQGKRGPVETHFGFVRTGVIAQQEPDGSWVARVPTLTEHCVSAPTREMAIRKACAAVSIPEPEGLEHSDVFVDFPRPWTYDAFVEKVSPARSSATVYAHDSTPVCRFNGAHSEYLAPLIVEAVNAYQEPIHPIDDPTWVHPEDCGYTVTGKPHNCFCKREPHTP